MITKTCVHDFLQQDTATVSRQNKLKKKQNQEGEWECLLDGGGALVWKRNFEGVKYTDLYTSFTAIIVKCVIINGQIIKVNTTTHLLHIRSQFILYPPLLFSLSFFSTYLPPCRQRVVARAPGFLPGFLRCSQCLSWQRSCWGCSPSPLPAAPPPPCWWCSLTGNAWSDCWPGPRCAACSSDSF